MNKTSTDSVILVGDAGGHTIPTVGGGVPPGLIIGRIAGETAYDHIQNGILLTDFEDRWRKQMGAVLDNSLRMRKMSDIVFRSKKLMDVITKLDWLTRETLDKFIHCEMDAKMRLLEMALQSGEIRKILK